MTPARGYSSQKDNYAKRLRRIEGQVRGIAKMIEDDKYCIDVLTQISAANNALRSVALNLLDEHLGHCVTRAVADGGTEADDKLAEAYAAAARLNEAITLHKQTLADRQRVLGPDHPRTLQSRDHLAEAYAAAGQLDEAISLHERNVADATRTMDPDNQAARNYRAHLDRIQNRGDPA